MKRIVPAARTGALLALLAFSARAASIRGTVSTASGPLPGAVVQAYDATGFLRFSASTDGAGQYALNVTAGSFRMLAYDPQGTYATVFFGNAESFDTTSFVNAAEGAPLEISFTLPRSGTLSGTVKGANVSLASAVVEVYNLSGTRRASTTVQASGAYSMALPPGDYKVFAYDVNDVFAGVFVQNARAFDDAAVVHVDAAGTTALSFSLAPAAHVTGTIVDAQTRTPLAGKVAYAYTSEGALVRSATTDASGTFRFSLASGAYRLVAGDPELMYAPVFYVSGNSFERADVLTFAAGETRSDIVMAAERGGVVRGRVAAATRMTVAAYNLDGTLHASSVTKDEGDYALVVAPGTYKLVVFDPNAQYATQFYAEASTFALATELAVAAQQTVTGIDFAPVRAGRFKGTVRDGATQQGIAAITIAAYDLAGVLASSATTGPGGSFALGVVPGAYRLVAFDARLDYATTYAAGALSYETTAPITITADQEQSIQFTMWRGVRVRGRVVDPDGGGIGGVEVFALDASGNRIAGGTTEGGDFTVVVQSGVYTFIARDPDRRYVMRTAGTTIAVGAQTPPSLTLSMVLVQHRRSVHS